MGKPLSTQERSADQAVEEFVSEAPLYLAGLLDKHGVTQPELASMLEWDIGRVRDIVTGRRKPSFQELSDVLLAILRRGQAGPSAGTATMSFTEFMRTSPLMGVELDLGRDPAPPREIDL